MQSWKRKLLFDFFSLSSGGEAYKLNVKPKTNVRVW